MKKNLMTAAAFAIGVLAFANLSTTASAGVLGTGLQNTANVVQQQDNIVTKAGWRKRHWRKRHWKHRHWRWHRHWGHRHWRRHGGWKAYKHCLWLQRQGYRIACNHF